MTIEPTDPLSARIAQKIWDKWRKDPQMDQQTIASILSHLMTVFISGFHPSQRREVLKKWCEGQEMIWDIYEAQDEAEKRTRQ